MALSDCSSCWETPCVCGTNYDVKEIKSIVDGWLKNQANKKNLLDVTSPVSFGRFNDMGCIEYILASMVLHQLATKHQVSYGLNWCCDSQLWYGVIDSPSDDDQRSITDDYCLSSVMELMVEHLLELDKQSQ